ncbi:MAG: nucleoside monophosphate kinase [Candidatus Zambryskibacteria bacterium]|nr:nucleoside monophosphate kinase [Candidatus Zambryskibacteria bacterium]
MKPQTFIFIGRSGCGKGTQAELLKKLILEKDPQSKIFYLETGASFRQFVTGEKYSNKLANEIYKKGDRQPDFLAVHMWSHVLIADFKGTEHAFFDGICRSLPEAMVFTTALEFYNRKATIIYINVSREWSEARLLARGRDDDKSREEIKKRLDWFDRDSYPAVEYFKSNDRYDVLDINGEQTIEKVHREIVTKLHW